MLALVLATATVANGNLALPFPMGAPQSALSQPNMLRQHQHPFQRGREAVAERFEVAKAAAAKVAADTLDLTKYPKLFAAGGICASLTHLVTVPLDVVKTRMQVTPGAFTSINDGISKIYAAEGLAGCMQGATPTFLGFMMQGALKYGFYEYFKDSLAAKIPPAERGDRLPIPQMMLAASAAEVLGTSCLLPFESIRIRMVADPSFGKGLFAVGAGLLKEQGIKGLYGGMLPILCKQIPFTISQFLVYEFASKFVYSSLAQSGVKDASATWGTAACFLARPRVYTCVTLADKLSANRFTHAYMIVGGQTEGYICLPVVCSGSRVSVCEVFVSVRVCVRIWVCNVYQNLT